MRVRVPHVPAQRCWADEDYRTAAASTTPRGSEASRASSCEVLTAARPGLRVLFMSGYLDDQLSDQGSLATDVNLLIKPLTAEVLLARVQQALHARLSPAPSSK